MKTHPALKAALFTFELDDETDWKMACMGRAMLRAYHRTWIKAHEQIEQISTEQTFTAELINPETGRRSRKLSLAG